MSTYAVIGFGSVLYETDSELIAAAWAQADRAVHGQKRTVCRRYKRGNYALTLLPKSPMGDMVYSYRLENDWHAEWPIYYSHTGKVGWDSPEQWPASILQWAEKLIKKIEMGGQE